MANESEGGGVVVVLSVRDKLTMDSEIARALPPSALRGTRVGAMIYPRSFARVVRINVPRLELTAYHLFLSLVCRSGSPLLTDDLERVSAHAARTVIILADESSGLEHSAEAKDAATLRAVLSLNHLSQHGGLRGPVVAEARAPRPHARAEFFINFYTWFVAHCTQ